MDLDAQPTTGGPGRHHVRRLLDAAWNAARELAWGIDAASRVRHGIDVPPDHGARRRPRVTGSECRPR